MTTVSSTQGDLLSTLSAQTTGITGRFLVNGPTYQMVSDSSMRGGGPGEAIGSLDLIVASVVVCFLNVMRVQDPENPFLPGHAARCLATVERSLDDDVLLGRLTLEVHVEGVQDEEVAALIETFRQRCRIYRALKQSLPMTFVGHGLGPGGRLDDLPDAIYTYYDSSNVGFFDCI